jgi:hypothetical protein
MSMRTICAQLVGFAVVLAALLILPQAAQAHAGHVHATHAPAAHVHATQVPADADARAADSSVTSEAAETRAEPSLTATTHSAPGDAADLPCSRGCCAQTSCAACFSLVVPMPPLMLPPALSMKMGVAANPQPSGIGGPSLRRPPRSFA